ncbi:MAG TPA: WecB/TagA/CpsF family glycosyltransferase [Actinomycetota bacterium]|nr:WecB/TagA/CpsF family glycosyltransferase [Actinomycetota bacterium]
MLTYVNAHTLNLATTDSSYAEVLRGADLVLNDGKGVLLAGLILGRRFPADLNGNFFTPLLLDHAAASGWSIYILGSRPGVAESVAEVLKAKHPGLAIAGTMHGHFSASDEDDVVARIRETNPGLLLVGMGNPLQERFLARRLKDSGARVGLGVGAYLDFQVGEVERAPTWMNRIGIEWVHRLVQEPRRMWRRYLLGNPLFVWRVLRARLRGGIRSKTS